MDNLDASLAALSARSLPVDLAGIDDRVFSGLKRAVEDERQFRKATMVVAGLMLLVGGTIGGTGTTEAKALPTMPLGVPSTLAPSTLLDPGL